MTSKILRVSKKGAWKMSVEAPCMMLGKKKVNYVCTRCRLQSNSSMCEDIDEMNFHNMSTHKKYTEENTIKEGVTSRTFNYHFSLDTSNRKF